MTDLATEPAEVRLDSRILRGAETALASALTLGSVAWAADLYRLAGMDLDRLQFLAAMLGIALPLAFIHLPARRRAPRTRVPWYDLLAAALSFFVCWYIAFRFLTFVDFIALPAWDQVAVSAILIVLIVESLRRATGNALTIIVVVFLLYGLFGSVLPGKFAARPQEWQSLAAYLAVDVSGIHGIALAAACTIVAAFILFGNLLIVSGGSQFFTEFALIAMGRLRGGAAKIAVLASGLFGSISGSAVANVVATGVVTIPMIKKGGYAAHRAGAIEAAASTGGQLMPPVMGAAAFLMAENLAIPYAQVVLAALVPGVLYYVALFIQADLEAARAGIARVDESEIPRWRHVVSGWFFVVPFAVLLVALFTFNMPPQTAALWSAVVLIVFSVVLGYRGQRPGLRALIGTIRSTGLAVLDIIMICGAAGIIIGILAVTGASYNFPEALVSLGAGSLFLLLIIAAVICIILGMGLPTLGVYVLLAALVTPALIKVGINPIAAHLYVIYMGMMSMVTPPVAIAAFAAAGVAKADPLRTGFAAMRFGWLAYLIPILFAVSPSLLLIGAAVDIVVAIATAAMGVWLVSIAIAGFFMRRLGVPIRAAFGAAGLLALIPGGAFAGADFTDIVGALAGIVLIAFEILQARRGRREEALAPGS